MEYFSDFEDRDESMGELILEALLSSQIESISDLNFSINSSWFRNPVTRDEREGNVDLLSELISKQAGLQHINLGGDFSNGGNKFWSEATLAILTRIAAHHST